MVPPDIIEAATVSHDEAILQCLSLVIDAHSRPLHTNPAAATDADNGTPSPNALSRARLQAFLPIQSGGLGLSCAQISCESAYVAAWADYLRLVSAHPSLFPSVSQLLTPANLEASGAPSIVALRTAYSCLADQFDRDDPELGAISGSIELRAILGDQVSGVGTLHLARAKPQRACAVVLVWVVWEVPPPSLG